MKTLMVYRQTPAVMEKGRWLNDYYYPLTIALRDWRKRDGLYTLNRVERALLEIKRLSNDLQTKIRAYLLNDENGADNGRLPLPDDVRRWLGLKPIP